MLIKSRKNAKKENKKNIHLLLLYININIYKLKKIQRKKYIIKYYINTNEIK